MRILVLTQFYPPEAGASAIQFSRLARMARSRGHAVTVLTGIPNYPLGRPYPGYEDAAFLTERIDGIEIVRTWVYINPEKTNRTRILNQMSFMVSAALRGTFLLKRPDVILIESHPLWVCLAGYWLSRLWRVPYVLNVSDLWPASAVAAGALRADSLLVKGAEIVERFAYRKASHVIAMSRGIRAGIERVVSDKCTFIPNASDLQRFHPNNDGAKVRENYGLEGKFVVSYVGNMGLVYDLDVIAKAANRLNTTHPDIAFFFAGSGARAEDFRAKVAGLDNVIMVGVLPHEEIPQVWAASDVSLVSHSDNPVTEGALSTRTIEAMAAGVPTIAGDKGETREMLLNAGAGLTFPPGNAEAMEAAVLKLRADPDLRAEMSASGRRWAEKHHDPEHVTGEYLRILAEAAGYDL